MNAAGFLLRDDRKLLQECADILSIIMEHDGFICICPGDKKECVLHGDLGVESILTRVQNAIGRQVEAQP